MYRSLPKEKQTAYERWEMASLENEELAVLRERRKAVVPADINFGPPEPEPEPEPEIPEEEMGPAEEEPEEEPQEEEEEELLEPSVTQATVEDVRIMLEDLRKEAQEAGYRAGLADGFVKGQEEGNEQGYREGFEKGRAEGFEKGEAEGFEKGKDEGYRQGETEGFSKGYDDGKIQGDEYVRVLKAVSESFANDVARANETIADDILELALDFTKAMIKRAFIVKPDLIVPVVLDAVRYLPSLQQPSILYLNPEDAVVVTDAIGQELEAAGWRIVEEQVPRGSCRIETASNQIESSLATRWQRLTTALGKVSNWVE